MATAVIWAASAASTQAQAAEADPFSDSQSEIYNSLRALADENGIVSAAAYRTWAIEALTAMMVAAGVPQEEAASSAAALADEAIAAFTSADYGTEEAGFNLDQAIAWMVAGSQVTDGGSDTGESTDTADNSGDSDTSGSDDQPNNQADDPTRKMGAGDQSISNTTAVTKSGVNAAGLAAVSGGTIDNDGQLTGVTLNADGQAISGNVSIVNSGNISVAGSGPAAIVGESLAGTVYIENSGALTTAGLDGYGIVGMTGHVSLSSSFQPQFTPGGAVTIKNSGVITTSGGGDSAAIVAGSIDGDITIENAATGTLVMTGAGDLEASAIYATSRSGDIAILNLARITVADQFGIVAFSENGDAAVTNSGTIVLGEGEGAAAQGSANLAGLASGSGTGKATVQNSGTVESKGWIEAAIHALSGVWNSETDAVEDAGAGVSVINSGTIKVAGDAPVSGENAGKSVAVVAKTAGSRIEIENRAGALIEGAQASSTAISADANGGETAITNAGTINGAVKAASGTNSLTNSGTINGVIAFAGGAGTITNSGVMTSTISLGSGADTVTNSGAMSAIVDLGAGTNSLANSGVLSGAVIAGSGNDTVTNSGTLIGSVDLGTGTNSFSNSATGLVRSGSEIDVGAGNTFTNEGTLSPGSAGSIQKTTIIGNFVQTSTGKMTIDVTSATSDVLEIVGRATLAGQVTANIVNLNEVLRTQYVILTATQGLANGSALSVGDTAGYDFEIVLSTGTDADGAVTLTAERKASVSALVSSALSAVAPAGTSSASASSGIVAENISAVGSLLSAIDTNSNSPLTPLVNAILLVADSPTAVADALNRLVPQNQGTQTSNTSNSAIAIGNAMFSCSERDGPSRWNREGTCYYAKIGARRLERDPTSLGAGTEETGYEVMGGAQVALKDQLRFGFALSYEDLSSSSLSATRTLGSSSGDRASLGLVLKNQWGPINAYLNLTGNYAIYDHTRYVNLGAGMNTANGEQDVWSAITRLRLTYTGDMGVWYYKPMIDLAATYLAAEGYTETGAGAANLRLSDADTWMLSAMPGLEVGGETRWANGTVLRPYVRAGVIMFADDEMSVTTTFASAPAGLTPFTVTGRYDQVAADVEAGFHVLTTSGVNMKLNYEGRYSEDSQQHGGGLKISAPY